LLREILNILEFSRQQKQNWVGSVLPLKVYESDVLNNSVYVEVFFFFSIFFAMLTVSQELAIILPFVLARCKAHISVGDVASSLLHSDFALPLVHAIVANDPSSFSHVVSTLIVTLEKLDAGTPSTCVL
jgi:uncharacterized membrane protein